LCAEEKCLFEAAVLDRPGLEESSTQQLINLVHINVDDRMSASSLTRIDAERADSTWNRFIGNDHVDHTPNARGAAVMHVKFGLRSAVSAAKMTNVA
jgi:hypothetical protein